MQPRDVIFKLREPNSGLFDTGAVVASTADSLQISISVGGLSKAQFRRRLETIASASGDASYNLVEVGTFSVKLPFLGQNLDKVSPNLG
ncbi:hypothetical protein DRQ11_09910 [candidate division KSB1 bacterium]|nr:MAG: hypothetical protein DRQ11_09910 [candidate division KSB1 bacterium]